ncbi:ArsR/SmtB family transcription factor [Pseudohaliea rubra]|uniref:Transcriptional regulator, ArsR family n=1 Tax=Pseudohaliea rubra DSM 19751 TaxID=1265313 RepID=A0A095VTR2_9GAMM|nr:metalloregulator ArsR/SmtB family transcription factor [Pseudohaliea rubra]KGE04852.1 Transcriptional regulator, ArsR family [Pseudohaliea rubra DSM 19751]
MDLDKMRASALEVTELLKLLGHRDRLLVLCELKTGEASVGDLAQRLGIKQSPLSQHLARMRHYGIVTARREAQSVYYRISDGKVAEVVSLLYKLYCSDDD